jgi:TusA-related sulfurtransferase
MVAELPAGELIEVLASDPHSVAEFRATSRPACTDLLESSRLGNVFRFVLRKR